MNTNPAIRAELERLTLQNGGILKAEAVVESARDPESPLHDQFQWDDTEAATQWRLQQARQLIRVVVRFEEVGNKQVPCRVFVSLTPDREESGGGYRVTTSVMADEDMRRQMLLDARREMTRFREKYSALSELAKVFEAMDSVQAPLEQHAGAA